MSPRLPSPLLLTQSDARLIELARAGQERAFEALVRRYQRQLLAHCRRILAADAAEDALQQGLLGAWLALQNGSEVREPRAWLHRIVHNAALRAAAPFAGHSELAEAELSAAGPEDQLIRRQDLRETLSALASLPELQREALVQTTLEGQSYESVARTLGLSETSLRGLIYRARARMRAAATAVTPVPLLSWLHSRARHGGEAAAVRVGSAGAPAAVGGMLVKSSALVLVVGAAAGGAGVAQLVSHSGRHHPIAHVHPAPRRLAPAAAQSTSGVSEAMLRVPVGTTDARRDRTTRVTRSARHAGSRGPSHGEGASGSGDGGLGRSGGSSGGPGPGAGSLVGDRSGSSSGSSSGSGPGPSGSDGGARTTTPRATTADAGGSGSGDSGSGSQTTDTSSGGGGGSGGGQSSTDQTSTSSSGPDG